MRSCDLLRQRLSSNDNDDNDDDNDNDDDGDDGDKGDTYGSDDTGGYDVGIDRHTLHI